VATADKFHCTNFVWRKLLPPNDLVTKTIWEASTDLSDEKRRLFKSQMVLKGFSAGA